MKTVDRNLQTLLRKMIQMHEKVDPNLQKSFYYDRLKSFSQPELIMEDVIFVFDSLSEKVDQLVQTNADQKKERLEKLVSRIQEPRRVTKTEQETANTVEPTKGRMEEWVKPKSLRFQRNSVDCRQKILRQKDLNLFNRASHNSKQKTVYATKLDIGRQTPRMKASTRNSMRIVFATQQSEAIENNPFEDSNIYRKQTATDEKTQQKSICIRFERARRNSVKGGSLGIVRYN